MVRLGWAPLVPVEVDGRSVPFLLDTGASNTALTLGGAQRLGLPMTAASPFGQGFGIGGASEAGAARVGSLRIGRTGARNVVLPVVRMTQGTEANPIAQSWYGMIGAELLRRNELELELAAGRAVLHPVSACPAGPPWSGEFQAIPATILPNGLPVLQGTVNGQPARALFDTGAQRSLLFHDAALRGGMPAAALAAAPAGVAHGFGTEAVPVHRMVLETLGLGPRLWRQVPMAVIPGGDNLPFDMIIGQDFIGGRRFWLSYARGVLYVQDPRQPGRPGAKPPPAASAGGAAQQP